MMQRLFLGLLIGAPVIMVATPFLLLLLLFWEPSDAKPGSLAYIFAIPSTAKRFPLWDPCGQPSFSYRGQDGTSPEIYWIDYETRLSNVEFARMVEDYTRANRCKYSGAPELPVGGSHIGLDIECGRSLPATQFAMPRAPTSGCMKVSVRFISRL